MSVSTLVDRLDEILTEQNVTEDFRSSALIALAFCDLLTSSLDENQKKAVEAAHMFWLGEDRGEHRKFVNEYAERISPRQIKLTPQEVAIDRLIWCALNNNTQFSSYTGEFLLGIGEQAGLQTQQMGDILSKLVPGF